jgi:hypothetical protein
MSNKALNHVWQHSTQKGSALVLMLALADMANDDGECYPGKTKLAEKCRVSKVQLTRLIQQCEQAGELRVISKYDSDAKINFTNRYLVVGVASEQQLLEARPVKSQNDTSIVDDTRVVSPVILGSIAHDTTPGIVDDTRVVSPVIPKPSFIPQLNPSENPKEILFADANVQDVPQSQTTAQSDTSVTLPVKETIEPDSKALSLSNECPSSPPIAPPPSSPAKGSRRKQVKHPELVQAVKAHIVEAMIAVGKWRKEDIGVSQYKFAEVTACDLCDRDEPVQPDEIISLTRYCANLAQVQKWGNWTPRVLDRYVPDWRKAQRGQQRVYADPSHVPLTPRTSRQEPQSDLEAEYNRLLDDMIAAKTTPVSRPVVPNA